MTDLAKLVVKLEAQSAQLTKELQTATRKIDTFEKGVKSAVGRVKSAFSGFAAGFAGAFSVGAITQFAKATIDMADEVNRASQVVGLSTEVFSGLQYAAKQAGVETATFQTSLTKLSKTAVDAADGTGTAADAFKALGVSVKGADGSLKSIDQLLLETAEAFSQYGDSAEKTAAAQAIFGKSGAELLPFLNEGKAGIEALTAEAERLGLVISSDAAKAADQFNDTMDRLQGAVSGAAQGVIQKLLPSLNGLATLAADSATESSALTAVMEGLAVAFKVVASGAIIVGNAFQAVAKTAGGFVAVIVTALQGDFKRAMDVYNEMAASVSGDIRDIGEGIAATWHGAASEVASSANSMQESNKKLGFRDAGDEAKKAKTEAEKLAESIQNVIEKLREQDATFGQTSAQSEIYTLKQLGASEAQIKLAQSIADSIDAKNKAADIEKYLDGLREEAATVAATTEATNAYKLSILGASDAQMQEARQLSASIEDQKHLSSLKKEAARIVEDSLTPLQNYQAEITKLNELIGRGLITQGQYNAAVIASQDAYEKARIAADPWAKEMAAIGDQAARNIQDAFADFLFDPFDKGLDGMLKSFADTLQRMVAEAASKQIFRALTQSVGGGSGGGGFDWGGILGTAASWVGGLFAGGTSSTGTVTRDSGGHSMAGQPALIGVGAQPELFVPDRSGTFYPRDEWMGSKNVTYNINVPIQAPAGTVDRRTQQNVAAEVSRTVRNASVRNG